MSSEASYICLPSNSTALAGGGPPGGICTLECAAHATCEAVSPSALCINFGGVNGYCIEGCTIGVESPPDQPKCHGRPEFACTPMEATTLGPTCSDYHDCAEGQACYAGQCAAVTSACLPACVKDSDCASGTFCDREWGTCGVAPEPGLPLGTECDPAAADDPCAGFCVEVTDVPNLTGLCSENCSYESQCGFGSGSEPTGACLLPTKVNEATTGLGDQAFCSQFCECSADCLTPSYGCVPVNIEATAGHSGVCAYPFTIQGEPLETLEDCP
jgi:hypothetical protein